MFRRPARPTLLASALRRLALAALAALVAASAAGCVVEDPRYFGSYLFWYNRDHVDYVLAQEGGDGYYVLPASSAGSMPVHGAAPYTVLVIATPGCGVVAKVAPAKLEHVVVSGGAAAVEPRTDAAPDVPQLKGTEWCLGRVPGLSTPRFAP
jgi:hypothetical protein